MKRIISHLFEIVHLLHSECGQVNLITLSFCSGGQTGLTRLADGAAGDDGMFCGDAVALASISMKIERDCLPRPKQYNELIMCPQKE